MAKKKKNKQGSGVKIPLPDVNDNVPFTQVAKEAKAQERKDTIAAIKYALKSGDTDKARHIQGIWNKLIDVSISYSTDDKEIKAKARKKLALVSDDKRQDKPKSAKTDNQQPEYAEAAAEIPGVDSDYF